ncbi:hypothetical protein [Devosia alba]|uniref:hypothetical protein n=1 Tax=Devosia alba TaxID=3152360 RepID=UPI00326486A1
MSKSNNISKLESIFNKMLDDSQSKYESWLLSAATFEATSSDGASHENAWNTSSDVVLEDDFMDGREAIKA